jgi:hypothetical protein
MLLQHQTASLIDSGIPDGWEEEMTFGVGEQPRGGTKRRVTKRGERARVVKREDGGQEDQHGSRSGEEEEDDPDEYMNLDVAGARITGESKGDPSDEDDDLASL